jgi:hypothetical protein
LHDRLIPGEGELRCDGLAAGIGRNHCGIAEAVTNDCPDWKGRVAGAIEYGLTF